MIINLPKDRNNPIILKEKLIFLYFLSKNLGKNLTSIKTIHLKPKFNFGNQFLLLNKAIFYCEIIRCKRILLNKRNFWFIKNKIIDNENRMKIKLIDKKVYKTSGLINDKTLYFFSYINYIKPELKINLLKKEIFRNLPKITINTNDLYIYIRSDDIFISKNPHKDYAQPPLCFYQKIIINNKFKNIVILSKNKYNPNIKKLLSQFPSIIYNQNSLKLDISYLSNAYNLVKAQSTLFFSILYLNKNIRLLWEFDFQNHIESSENYLEKFLNSFNKPKRHFIIYRMKASTKYKNEMQNWKNSASQIHLMINENCPYNFTIINNNIN